MGESDLPAEIHSARSTALTRWGFAGSALYVLAMAVWSASRWGDIVSLSPADMGTFLAGLFSPLAFLWLVLGFLQQGQELRASVEALKLQGEELRNSVEQQRELVAVTRDQLEFQSKRLSYEDDEMDRAAQPILELSNYGNGGSPAPGNRVFYFKLDNYGKPATKVHISLADGKRLHQWMKLADGEHTSFELELSVAGSERHLINVDYVDARGLSRRKHFVLTREDTRVTIRPQDD